MKMLWNLVEFFKIFWEFWENLREFGENFVRIWREFCETFVRILKNFVRNRKFWENFVTERTKHIELRTGKYDSVTEDWLTDWLICPIEERHAQLKISFFFYNYWLFRKIMSNLQHTLIILKPIQLCAQLDHKEGLISNFLAI